MMRHRHSVTEDPLKLIGIAAIAAAVGATVATLITPRSGRQVRGGLRRRAYLLRDDVRDRLLRSIDEAEDVSEEAKQRLQATATKVADDAKSTATKVADDAKATSNGAKSAAKETTKPRNS